MPSIKTIDHRGRLTLSEQPANRFVPQDELWLHEPGARDSLDRAVRWAQENPPRETDLEEISRWLG